MYATPIPPDDQHVGMIGLGLMGAALAARLTAAGFAVTGFDIDDTKCETLRRNGGVVATSASEVFAQCRTIILAVFNASEIEGLFDQLAAFKAHAGTSVICTTTCAPDEIAILEERAADHDCAFIEAPP